VVRTGRLLPVIALIALAFVPTREQQAEKRRRAIAAMPPPPPASSSPAPNSDRLDQLKKVTELRDAGALTREEFELEKARAMRLGAKS
jgi:hypothetical protein